MLVWLYWKEIYGRLQGSFSVLRRLDKNDGEVVAGLICDSRDDIDKCYRIRDKFMARPGKRKERWVHKAMEDVWSRIDQQRCREYRVKYLQGEETNPTDVEFAAWLIGCDLGKSLDGLD